MCYKYSFNIVVFFIQQLGFIELFLCFDGFALPKGNLCFVFGFCFVLLTAFRYGFATQGPSILIHCLSVDAFSC